jgi:hypothetical protein
MTGMPEIEAVRIFINDQAVDRSNMHWRVSHDTLVTGGPDVAPGRSGHQLGSAFQQVTITPPAKLLRCGDNELGFYLTSGPMTEHTHIRVHELEVHIWNQRT